MKRVLLKAEETGDDSYLGLLNLNNTPLNGISPAEKMFDRRPHTLLPSVDTNKHMEKITDSRLNSYDRYNEGARDLKSIEPDTPVRIYSKRTKDWSNKGIVTEQLHRPKSYNILNERGNTIRRNRRSLIPTSENFEVKRNYDEIIVVDDNKEDSTEMVYSSTEQGQIETTYNYQEQAQPDNSYRSKLRKNIIKLDRYGY